MYLSNSAQTTVDNEMDESESIAALTLAARENAIRIMPSRCEVRVSERHYAGTYQCQL
jgi:hypothetical protein